MSDQLDLFDSGGAPTSPVRGKKARPDGGRAPAKGRGAPSSPERPAPSKVESLGGGASPAASTRVLREDLAASPENEGAGVLARSSEEAAPVPPLDCARDLLCMTCYRWTQVIEPQGPFTDPTTYKCGQCLEGKT